MKVINSGIFLKEEMAMFESVILKNPLRVSVPKQDC